MHPANFVKDSAITTKIKAKLAADQAKSLLHVSVDTDANGAVVLSGHVRTDRDANRAMALARETDGVTSVKSTIEVRRDD
jgi:hyperosmotically inducible protein